MVIMLPHLLQAATLRDLMHVRPQGENVSTITSGWHIAICRFDRPVGSCACHENHAIEMNIGPNFQLIDLKIHAFVGYSWIE